MRPPPPPLHPSVPPFPLHTQTLPCTPPFLLSCVVQLEEMLFPILQRYISTEGQDVFEEIMQARRV